MYKCLSYRLSRLILSNIIISLSHQTSRRLCILLRTRIESTIRPSANFIHLGVILEFREFCVFSNFENFGENHLSYRSFVAYEATPVPSTNTRRTQTHAPFANTKHNSNITMQTLPNVIHNRLRTSTSMRNYSRQGQLGNARRPYRFFHNLLKSSPG